MAHLTDKLADYFYKELPAAEMACAARREARFAGRAPDWDPPRNIVFSEPQRSSWLSWLDWRPLAASTAAAALVAGLIVRLSPVPPPAPAVMPVAPPAVVQAEKVDYNRIVNEVRQSEREWLAAELQARDREIQRLQAEIVYYDTFQRTVMKETLQNGSAIQLLAQRTEQR